MQIREINERATWEDFLSKCKEKTFLSSFSWGEFQEKEGNKIWRLGIFEQDKLISVSLVVKVKAKRGTFLFVPHGPVLLNDEDKTKVIPLLIQELKNLCLKEKAVFLRISPILLRNEENENIFKSLKMKDAPIHMHPEITWELSLSPSFEEILKGMRKTTRYLIRQAEKNKDIQIVKENSLKGVELFNEIYKETAKRHKFTPFSLNYLKNEFLCFNKNNEVALYLGKYKGEVVSSCMIIYIKDSGFYHQGASLSKYNNIPVSYAMQFEAIKEAKERGCKTYNFWGIQDEEHKNHPWAGLTLFKMGFGGYRKEYVKTKDLPLSPLYLFNFIIEKLRKIKRGL